jgi:hypothetical protein
MAVEDVEYVEEGVIAGGPAIYPVSHEALPEAGALLVCRKAALFEVILMAGDARSR